MTDTEESLILSLNLLCEGKIYQELDGYYENELIQHSWVVNNIIVSFQNPLE